MATRDISPPPTRITLDGGNDNFRVNRRSSSFRNLEKERTRTTANAKRERQTFPHSSSRNNSDVFRRRPENSSTIRDSGDIVDRRDSSWSGRRYEPSYQASLHAGSNSSSDHRPLGNFPNSSHTGSTPSSESTHHSFHPPPMIPHPVYPHHGYGLPIAHSPSFESHARCPPPLTTFAPPVTYSYGLPPHPPSGYPHYQWTMAPVVEYISKIKPDDVLSGRGGATNSHSGNRAFRSLVKQYQDQYLRAKKRDKPTVASRIVEIIRDKGGRFLRRVDTSSQGQVLWVDIGDDRAREKTCQALREGAPELRRKRKASSSADEDDIKQASRYKDGEVGLSSSSSIDRSASGGEHEDIRRQTWRRASFGTQDNTADIEIRDSAADLPADEPIMIRASARLTRSRLPHTICVDQLEAHERELYLRDFLPPNPGIRKKPTTTKVIHASSQNYDSSSGHDDSTERWSTVEV